jgi:hypothetical protein
MLCIYTFFSISDHILRHPSELLGLGRRGHDALVVDETRHHIPARFIQVSSWHRLDYISIAYIYGRGGRHYNMPLFISAMTRPII